MTSTSSPHNETSLDFMRQLIGQYITRQQLVALAMLEVHPTGLTRMGTHVLGIEIAPYIERWYEKISENPNWQGGIWRYTWRHWAHGLGCELIHINSGEPIEWEAPDLHAFDEIWFWNHMSWRIANSRPAQWQHYYDQFHSLYDTLLTRGDLVLTDSDKLKLTPQPAATNVQSTRPAQVG